MIQAANVWFRKTGGLSDKRLYHEHMTTDDADRIVEGRICNIHSYAGEGKSDPDVGGSAFTCSFDRYSEMRDPIVDRLARDVSRTVPYLT